jgi:hypothetical protein
MYINQPDVVQRLVEDRRAQLVRQTTTWRAPSRRTRRTLLRRLIA